MIDGERIGRYRLVEVLGHGSYATVWHAFDSDLERDVALKVLHEHVLDGEGVQRFLAEVKRAVQLTGPHVVPVFEAGTATLASGRQTHYMASQLVDGVTLGNWFQFVEPSFAEIARVAAGIARGLQTVHEASIIHRDLKPDNILVDLGGTPFITDFGLSVTTGIRVTQSGMVVGSVAYMSPEQARGERHLTPASDIFSFGVVLFELLTRRLPYPDATFVDYLRQLETETPPNPRHLNRDVPPDLSAVCLKCLEREPRDRYSSATELLNDLNNYLDGQPVHARPPGFVRRAIRWTRRRFDWVVAALIVLSVGLLGASAAVWQIARAQEAAQQALHVATQQTQSAQHQSARLAIERGIALCQTRRVEDGLLWFARSLELCPANFPTLETVIRRNVAEWMQHLHPLIRLLPHPGSVVAVHFLGNEPRLLTAGDDGVMRIWDLSAATDQPVHVLAPRGPGLGAVAVTPDGQFGLASYDGATITIWDLSKGTVHAEQHRHSGVTRLACHPNGRLFASGSTDGSVSIWSLEGGSEPLAQFNDSATVTALAFSPHGSHLVIGQLSGYVRAYDWNTQTESIPARLFRHAEAAISAAAFDPRGESLVLGTSDHRLSICRWPTLEVVAVLADSTQDFSDLRVSSQGDILAAGSIGGAVRLWTLPWAERLGSTIQLDCLYPTVALSATQGLLVAGESRGSRSMVRVYTTATPDARIESLPMQQRIGCVALNRSADRVYLADEDDQVYSFPLPLATGHYWKMQSAPRDQNSVWRLELSQDGEFLGVCRARDLQVVAARDGQVVFATEEFAGGVSGIAFSPVERVVAIPWRDGTIRRYDLDSRQFVGTPLGPLDGIVSTCRYSTDGRQLLAGGGLAAPTVWDLRSGQRHGGQPTENWLQAAIQITQTGDWLTGTRQGAIQIWRHPYATPFASPIKLPSPFIESVFSPDGQSVLGFGGIPEFQLFDVATGLAVGPPTAQGGSIYCSAFSADSRWIANAGPQGLTLRTRRLAPPVTATAQQLTRTLERLTGRRLDAAGLALFLAAEPWRALAVD